VKCRGGGSGEQDRTGRWILLVGGGGGEGKESGRRGKGRGAAAAPLANPARARVPSGGAGKLPGGDRSWPVHPGPRPRARRVVSRAVGPPHFSVVGWGTTTLRPGWIEFYSASSDICLFMILLIDSFFSQLVTLEPDEALPDSTYLAWVQGDIFWTATAYREKSRVGFDGAMGRVHGS
jgi:hypothetical protein